MTKPCLTPCKVLEDQWQKSCSGHHADTPTAVTLYRPDKARLLRRGKPLGYGELGESLRSLAAWCARSWAGKALHPAPELSLGKHWLSPGQTFALSVAYALG